MGWKSTGEMDKRNGRADILINLTGKSVNCRYTAKIKKKSLIVVPMPPIYWVMQFSNAFILQSFG
jgi:hypothetical protein